MEMIYEAPDYLRNIITCVLLLTYFFKYIDYCQCLYIPTPKFLPIAVLCLVLIKK